MGPKTSRNPFRRKALLADQFRPLRRQVKIPVWGDLGIRMTLAFGLIMMVPGLPAALPLMLVAGFGWNVTIATLNAELQLFLPS